MIGQLSFRILWLLALASGVLFCLPLESASAHGEWSREATLLRYKGETRKVEVIASDRRKTAVVEGVSVFVKADGRRLLGTENEGVSTLAELAWASDSTAFYMTQSLGGAVGEWRVAVYEVEKESVRVRDVTQEVMKQFKKHYKCKEPEEPNVGAVKWLNGSKELLVIAEVPPHSSCPEMGKVRGYLVEVLSGKITQEFGERELRARWGRYLGQRFSPK
jgi:hypothetical protein